MKKVGKLLTVLAGCLAMIAPGARGEVITCKAQKSNCIQAHKKELNTNKGSAKTIKVKDRENYFIAGFDLSAAKGKEITGAVLYVKGGQAAELGPVPVEIVSTIACDWEEGISNGDVEEGASCFTCAEYPSKKWNGGTFQTVAFGAGGSLKNSRTMSVPVDGWGACELDLPLIKALVEGKQFGIAIAVAPGDYKNYYLHGRRSAGNEPIIKVFVGEPVKVEAEPVKAAPKPAEAAKPPAPKAPPVKFTQPPLPAGPFNVEGLKSDGALVRSAQDDQKSPVFGFDDFEVIPYVADEKVPAGEAGQKLGYMARSIGITMGMAYAERGSARWVDAGFDKIYLENAVEGFYIRNKGFKENRELFQKGGMLERKYMIRKPFCFNDPAFREKQIKERIIPDIEGNKGHLQCIDLRDEPSYTIFACPMDYCLSAHCLKALRAWLQKTYGTLEALNRQWGSDFKDWESVEPQCTEKMRVDYAKNNNLNLSSWSDWRTFNDDTFNEHAAFCANEFRKRGVNVPTGFCGTQMASCWGGYDLWKLSKAVDFIESYDIRGAHTIFMSFNDRRYPITSTIGGGGVFDTRRVWQRVLEGDRGVIIWCEMGDAVPGNNVLSFQADNLGVGPGGANIAATVRPMQRGIVKLLSNLNPEKPAVAIHYSQRSLQADWVFETKVDGDTWPNRFSSWEAKVNEMGISRDSLIKIFEDLGYAAEFVSYEEVAAGDLVKKGYKVFWMPRSIAVSAEEAKAIEQFVEQGGTAVADMFPARMDGHCKLLSKGALDGLFGIESTAFAFPDKPQDLRLEGTDVKFKGFVDKSFKVTTGKPLHKIAGQPAVIQNKKGKGQACLLGFDPHNYVALRGTPGDEKPMLAFFGKLLAESGVQPACAIQTEKGAHPSAVRIFAYQNADLKLFGLIRNFAIRESVELVDHAAEMNKKLGFEEKLTVALPASAYTYNPVTGKSYGKTDKVEETLDPNKPIMLVQAPYQIEGLEGNLSGGNITLQVKVAAGGPAPKLNIVHLDVFDANGVPLYKNSQNLIVRDGVFKGQLEPKKAEVAGKLKLRFTELLSGKTWEGGLE